MLRGYCYQKQFSQLDRCFQEHTPRKSKYKQKKEVVVEVDDAAEIQAVDTAVGQLEKLLNEKRDRRSVRFLSSNP